MAGNPYLPGINVTLNDLGLKVAPPPAGPKVTILGCTSNTGVPLLEPYTVASVEKALNTLYFQTGDPATTSGRFPGEIALAMEQAVVAGAPNIEVVVIAHKSGDPLLGYIDPNGTKTGRYIDLSGAYDLIRNRDLDVVLPAGVAIDYYDTGSNFTDNFGKQLGDLCFQATQESNSAIGVIPTQSVLQWAWQHQVALISDSTVADNTYPYTGGSASVFSGELNTLFGTTYPDTGGGIAGTNSGLARKSVSFETPSSALTNEWHAYHSYPNDQTKFKSKVSGEYNAAYRNWLRGAEDQNGNTHAEPTDINANGVHGNYFTSWQAKDSLFKNATDSRNIKIDAGGYISVFSAPVKATSTQINSLAIGLGGSPASTQYSTDGAGGYAGLITSLAPQSSTTNKFIDGMVALKSLSPKQANDLVLRRHVTMFNRSTGFVVASGVTGAHNVTNYVRSDYVRLSTVRITHAAVDLIRAVGDKYIGEPNNAPQMNALRGEIDQVLLSMKGSGALNAYDYVVTSTPDQRVLGKVDINLTLVPAFEVTEINLVVSLAKEL